MSAQAKGKGKKPVPTSLHDIIVDYVSTQAYPGTAQALARKQQTASPSAGPSTTTNGETGDVEMGGETNGAGTDGDTPMDGIEGEEEDTKAEGPNPFLLSTRDLESIERRRVLINYILNGAIIRAIDSLNTHFPSVLDTSAPTSPTASTRPPGNPWTNGSRASSSNYASSAKLPLSSTLGITGTSTSGSSTNGASGSSLDHTVPVLPQSTVPAHVQLNLQIQQFIESFRQLAPSSPSSSASSISSLTSSMYLPLPGSTNGTAPRAETNGTNTNGMATSSSGINTKVTLTNALTAAQGLHTEAKKLAPDVRAVYLQEIKDVGALFAYTDPETSILKGFLDQSRRIALADQVNRAILKSQGQATTSCLEDCVRRTTAVYSIMTQRGVDPRPSNWKEPETGRAQLLAYWKHHVGPSTQFSLREFVGQSW